MKRNKNRKRERRWRKRCGKVEKRKERFKKEEILAEAEKSKSAEKKVREEDLFANGGDKRGAAKGTK